MKTLRSQTIRLAAFSPKDSSIRKALLSVLAYVDGTAQIGGQAIILGGVWDGSEGEVTKGQWVGPNQPA